MAVENMLFNKYSYEGVVVSDETLKTYLRPDIPGIVPHTANKMTLGRFGLAHKSIIERFTTHLMSGGRNTGKKRLAIQTVKKAFEKISNTAKKNPIQCLVDAIINSGPREISARIGKGGNMRRSSADVSPYKRINIALSYLSEGIRKQAFKNQDKTLVDVVSMELINAANNSLNSFAVKKRDEVERIAKSNR